MNVWPPKPGPEIIAAYKLKARRLRAQAFNAEFRSAGRAIAAAARYAVALFLAARNPGG